MRLRVQLPASFIRDGESELDALMRWIREGNPLEEVSQDDNGGEIESAIPGKQGLPQERKCDD